MVKATERAGSIRGLCTGLISIKKSHNADVAKLRSNHNKQLKPGFLKKDVAPSWAKFRVTHSGSVLLSLFL